MLNKQNAQILGVLLLGAVVLFWLFALAHPSFHTCINEAANTYRAEHQSQNQNPVASVPFMHGYLTCADSLARHDGEAITALATALLTIITLGLVFLGIEQSKTNRAQLRPYVYPLKTKIFDGGTYPNNPFQAAQGVPHCIIDLQNFGNTPAFNARHFSAIEIRPISPDLHVLGGPLTYPPDTNPNGGISLGPKAIANRQPHLGRALTQFERTNITSAAITHAVIIYGRILYRDTFGADHKTDYCFGYSGAWPPINPEVILIYMSDGNDSD